jgi:hypothetical protein
MKLRQKLQRRKFHAMNKEQVYAQEMINVHVGQGLDICWHSRKLGGGITRP